MRTPKSWYDVTPFESHSALHSALLFVEEASPALAPWSTAEPNWYSGIGSSAISSLEPPMDMYNVFACAEHFRQIGQNGLKIEKETTHFHHSWTRVASMA